MKRRHWILLSLGGIVIGLIVLPNNRRTPVGHLLRYISGHSGGQQAADDLADAIEDQVGRSRFREYIDNILDTHRPSGPLETHEIPAMIRHLSGELPFTAEVCSLDKYTTYVHLSWGLSGIYAGRADFKNPPKEWYLRSIQSGIFVYFREH